jgi:hypothetical protein
MIRPAVAILALSLTLTDRRPSLTPTEEYAR